MEKNKEQFGIVKTSIPKVSHVVEYFFLNYQDFLKNEVFVLSCLVISAFMLGVYPNFFVQYFSYDLETILQITFL